MALNEHIVLEAKIAGDINEFFNMDNLLDLVSKDEVNEAVEAATQHSRKPL